MRVRGLLLFMLSTVAACSSEPGNAPDDASPAPLAAQVTVEQTLLSPMDVEVAIGGEVTWLNMDTEGHHLVDGAPNGSSVGQLFDSDVLLAPNGFVPFSQFSVTFSAGGEVPYHCVNHPDIMIGKVIVR